MDKDKEKITSLSASSLVTVPKGDAKSVITGLRANVSKNKDMGYMDKRLPRFK